MLTLFFCTPFECWRCPHPGLGFLSPALRPWALPPWHQSPSVQHELLISSPEVSPPLWIHGSPTGTSNLTHPTTVLLGHPSHCLTRSLGTVLDTSLLLGPSPPHSNPAYSTSLTPLTLDSALWPPLSTFLDQPGLFQQPLSPPPQKSGALKHSSDHVAALVQSLLWLPFS